MTDRCKKVLRKGFQTYPCSKPASRDGYCGVHHPEAVKSRAAKHEAKWQAKQVYWRWQAEESKAIKFVVQTAIEWERGEAPEELLRQSVAELKRARRGLREASGPAEQDTPSLPAPEDRPRQ